MNYLAAHGTTTLRMSLSRTSVDIAQAEFEIVNATGQVIDQSGAININNRSASWDWTPNTGTNTALADDKDTLLVTARVKYSFSGLETLRDIKEITVFRDRVNIKIVTDVDGTNKVVKDARVRLVAHRPGIIPRQTLGSLLTAATGIANFEGILRWTSIDIIVKTPWELANDAAPYTRGNDKGLNREVLVAPKSYLATFAGIRGSADGEFADVAELDGQRKQYVNFDAFDPDHDTMYDGENASHFGHKIQLLLTPSEKPRSFRNESIFIKVTPGSGNNERTSPAPALTGADENGIAELQLGSEGTAIATLELGLAGGDSFKVQICSAKKFSTVSDQEFEIITWRRVYYELMAPLAMSPALQQVELPDSAGDATHYDFNATLRTQIEKTLDPVFLEYKLARSLIYPNNELASPTQMVDPTFFGRPPGRQVFIASSKTLMGPDHAFHHSKSPRVGTLGLVDILFNNYIDDYSQSATTETVSQEFSTSDSTHHLVPDTEALQGSEDAKDIMYAKPTVHIVGWRALIDTKDPQYEKHPALASELNDRLDKSCVTVNKHNKVTVTLPSDKSTDPGSFVGPLTDKTCPISIRLTLNQATTVGGTNMNGAMIVKLGAREDHNAFVLCHELGHSMGLGQLHAQGMSSPPPGLPTAKHIDEGGNYYTESGRGEGRRRHGKGPHCASGLEDMTIKVYPTEPDENVCVMFGFAPAHGNPNTGEPHPFCDQCQLYLKAMDLRSI